MTCPCGRPLDMGVDHGDTETGDPICATCCTDPDCNPPQPKETIDMKTITIDGTEYAPVTDQHRDSPVRIVVLQRGWVAVGYWDQDGEQVTISGARTIRRWGTTRGLGELVDGPLTDTTLDLAGTIQAHQLGVVFTIAANADAWKEHLG